jgi:hypothetical protein
LTYNALSFEVSAPSFERIVGCSDKGRRACLAQRLLAIVSRAGARDVVPALSGPTIVAVGYRKGGRQSNLHCNTRVFRGARAALWRQRIIEGLGPKARPAATPLGIRPRWRRAAAPAVRSLVSLSRPAVHKFRLVSRGSHRGPWVCNNSRASPEGSVSILWLIVRVNV